MGFKKNRCLHLFILFISIIVSVLVFTLICVVSANESLIKCSIRDLSIPSISSSSSSNHLSLNTSSNYILFGLQLKQESVNMGVEYDNLNVTFSYVAIQVANDTIPGFHQKGGAQKGSTIYLLDYAMLRPVDVATNTSLSSSLQLAFRVDLTTSVRFNYWYWVGRRHKFVASGEVDVNGVTGKMVNENGVKLRRVVGRHHSQAAYRAVYAIAVLLYILFSFACFLFLGFILFNQDD